MAANWEGLYGAHRTVQATRLRETLTKSHVLQAGEYNNSQSNNELWKTSNSLDYLSPRPHTTPNNVKPKGQLGTHFNFQADTRDIPAIYHKASVTSEDYHVKPANKPHVLEEPKVVNWPDMAPQYATDRNVGPSVYSDTFLDKSLVFKKPTYSRQDTSKMRLPVSDKDRNLINRHVSVNLGYDDPSYESEASRYSLRSAPAGLGSEGGILDMVRDAKNITKTMRNMNINSNVFREGDYDGLKQSSASIFTTDYCKQHGSTLTKAGYIKPRKKSAKSIRRRTPKPEVPGTVKLLPDIVNEDRLEDDPAEDEPVNEDDDGVLTSVPQLIGQALSKQIPDQYIEAAAGRDDQTNAHFWFGSDEGEGRTIYNKDYGVGTRAKHNKPLIVQAPVDSKVLQSEPEREQTGRTNNSTEYGPLTFTFASSVNPGYKEMNAKTTARRHGNNVILSFDENRHATDRQSSLCHSSYTNPPENFKAMAPKTGERPLYNYLETDVVQPFPVTTAKQSENQTHFRGGFLNKESAANIVSTNRKQQFERNDNNLGTHFVFGYDPKGFVSEHVHEYTGKRKNARPMAAAGKKEIIPDKKFAHIDMSENQQDLSVDPSAPYKRDCRGRSVVARSMPTAPIYKASVMANDFTPLNHREVTEAQRMMFKQNDIMSSKDIAPSHFFHTDHPTANNMKSTNTIDFVQPAAVRGRQFIAAR